MPGTPIKLVRFESSLPKPPIAGRYKYFAPGWRLALVGHFRGETVCYETAGGTTIAPHAISAAMIPLPYRWAHAIRRQRRKNTIFVVQSERDCLSLSQCRVAGICGPAGRWLAAWNPLLAAGTVAVLTGRDRQGQEWALQVAKTVSPSARTRIVTLPAEGPHVFTRWVLMLRLPCKDFRDIMDCYVKQAQDFKHP